MKLIKRGQIPAERLVLLICTNCKSEYEAALKELEYYTNRRNEGCYHWTCEVCKRINYTIKLNYKE